MNLGLEYIKYRWNAKGSRGIRSPFIQNLQDNCLTISKDPSDLTLINSIVKGLASSNDSIDIEDFGAGSKKLGNTRTIKSILKTSSSKGKYGDFLYRICKHYKFNNILEFGTSLGIGSIHMQLGNKLGNITTIEACKNTRNLALSNFEKIENHLITSIESTFESFLNESESQIFDLIFVDGHHDGKALLSYMQSLRELSDDNTIFILDDIRWSESMLSAWDTLRNDDEFHISIDLFRFGILSRRQSVNKEHHTINL